VVMNNVGREDVLEVAPVQDQQPVETLTADAADPTFGVRSRLWRPDRRLDDTDSFGAEDLIEVTGELAVAVTDEKPRPGRQVVKLHEQVARLLGHPAAVRVGRDPGQVNAPSRQLDKEQDAEALQEQRVDGEEVALKDARRLRSQELKPARLS